MTCILICYIFGVSHMRVSNTPHMLVSNNKFYYREIYFNIFIHDYKVMITV